MGPRLGRVAGSSTNRALLADANVLIDYQQSDLGVLALAGQHVGPLVVLSSVLREVDKLSEDDCRGLGVQVIEATPGELAQAQDEPLRAHINDRLCFIVCREQGLVCLTNDGKLRRYCLRNGVPTRFGLGLMVDLVAGEALSLQRAEAVAHQIRASNSAHITPEVLEQFLTAARAASHSSIQDRAGTESALSSSVTTSRPQPPLRRRRATNLQSVGRPADVRSGAPLMSDKSSSTGIKPESTEIFVNGRTIWVTNDEPTFDELVDLAFDDPKRGPQILFTITFRRAAGRFDNGELDPGRRLKVQHGTEVEITRTDQS